VSRDRSIVSRNFCFISGVRKTIHVVWIIYASALRKRIGAVVCFCTNGNDFYSAKFNLCSRKLSTTIVLDCTPDYQRDFQTVTQRYPPWRHRSTDYTLDLFRLYRAVNSFVLPIKPLCCHVVMVMQSTKVTAMTTGWPSFT
jgi:hypothetical protein